jgi:hypothetical protein
MYKRAILLVSAFIGAETLVKAIMIELECECKLVQTPKACVEALRRDDYVLLMIDQSCAGCSDVSEDTIRRHSGSAAVINVYLAFQATDRLVREARAELRKAEHIWKLNRRAVAHQLQGELKSTFAGLFLQSQVALTEAEEDLSPRVMARFRRMAEGMETLRKKLEHLEIEDDKREVSISRALSAPRRIFSFYDSITRLESRAGTQHEGDTH